MTFLYEKDGNELDADYDTRPSRESAAICMAICFAATLVLSVVYGALSWMR